jgi:uncharacterized membrane protein YoaK (UPF0700 family)
MISQFSTSRTLNDNIVLGSLTSFTAGMVNVASFMIFFSFTSNVTGYYAILAAEIAKGNVYQVAVVFIWIFLFMLGSFTSNLIIINVGKRKTYLAHALPVFLELICIASVGIYGDYFYQETLSETEVMLALLLYAMGIQNGFTASISNFAVKTTHLTGTTTDLGILFSMFTQKVYRQTKTLRDKAKLLSYIVCFYISGAITAGFINTHLGFKLFYLICFILLVVALYDSSKIRVTKYLLLDRRRKSQLKIIR